MSQAASLTMPAPVGMSAVTAGGRARRARGAVDARSLARRLEDLPVLPPGREARMVGYGVAGMAFASGDVLALHRIAASSMSPPYTAVRHRTPDGHWRVYTDLAPTRAASPYASRDAQDQVTTAVVVRWTSADALLVTVPAASLSWRMQLADAALTRVLADVRGNGAAPVRFSSVALRLLGWGATIALGAGCLLLQGRLPSGHEVRLHPQGIWAVSDSDATIRGRSLGSPQALNEPGGIGDLRLPRRGVLLFAAATWR